MCESAGAECLNIEKFIYINIFKHKYMAVKTITVKESAYEALKSLQLSRESFSDTILRIAKRKSLSLFYGVLSKKTGERLEKGILTMRKKRNEAHKARIKQIIEEFRGV